MIATPPPIIQGAPLIEHVKTIVIGFRLKPDPYPRKRKK